MIRYRKFGGFNVENEADRHAIERLLGGETDQIATETDTGAGPYSLGPVERDLVETRLRLGAELLRRGARDEAVAEWKAALRLDPENLTIRKQIWMAEHPERFGPVIDFAWQRGQLERERAAEIAAGICGPDGCPLPRAGER